MTIASSSIIHALELELDRIERALFILRGPSPDFPSARLRPTDLPSRSDLGKRRPHGHMMKYLAGCRCARCRRANCEYKERLAENRRLYGPNDLVPATKVRRLLAEMRKLGIGYKTVARHTRVSKTGLSEIWYRKKFKVRRRTEKKILAFKPSLDTMPATLCIPAEETIAKLRQLILWGYPKSLINREAIGGEAGALQVHALEGKTPHVQVRTARKVRDFFLHIERVRALWEEHRGEIPASHFVCVKDGASGNAIGELELRPFHRGHNYHYLYPPELKQLISLRGALKRQLTLRNPRPAPERMEASA